VVRGISLSVLLLAILGCAQPQPPKLDNTNKRLALITSVYMQANQKLGRAPAQFADLQPYFPASAGNFEEACKSDRDGQPFVIVWGHDTRGPQDKTFVLAYEQQGAQGKRYTADIMQMVTEVSNQDFATLPFPPGHTPK
jgi:hypothetical protein